MLAVHKRLARGKGTHEYYGDKSDGGGAGAGADGCVQDTEDRPLRPRGVVEYEEMTYEALSSLNISCTALHKKKRHCNCDDDVCTGDHAINT